MPKKKQDETENEELNETESTVEETVKKPEKKKKAPGNPEALSTQIVSLIFWICALLSTVFFIANIWDNAGPLIEGFSALFYGLFGWGGLVVVPLFILLGIEWKNYVVRRNALYKISFALVGMLIISALFHVIMIMNGGIDAPTSFIDALNSAQYWYKGSPLGGGVLGGFFGGIFYHLMHGWVSILTCLLLLIADLMLYLRLTPLKIAQFISAFLADRKKLRAARKEEEDEARAIEKQKADEERLREDEIRRIAEEETRLREEEELEKRRRNSGIEFDFLFNKDKPTQDETPTPPYNEAPDDETDGDDDTQVPLPPFTVYHEPDETVPQEDEKAQYPFDEIPDGAFDELDGAEDTDFGFGNDNEEFDLSALLAAGKKAAEENRNDSMDGLGGSDDEAETDEDEDHTFGLPVGVPPAPDKPAYVYPPVSLLSPNANPKTDDDREELMRNARKLVEVLKSFRVETDIVNISRGPTITRYELAPKIGVRVRAIANLVDDIALNLETSGVRIEAPIPGKAAVGVEVPNKSAEIVYLRDIIESSTFQNAKSKLTACVGMDVSGTPIVMDIAKLPHMLIAGATGMGKSIAVNCIIMSLLYKTTPDELKLILVDPKKVEFRPYDKLPHLLIPVVTNPKKAAGALATAVNEMERRFELIELAGVRDIKGYNKIAETDPTKEKLPSIVIIIDELADLMMTAKDDVEDSICRIAQKARAAGIHLIICTQRPSVDVITGLIKANVPSRIALTVASNIDSRTIIDVAGAEKLIGRGDMLFAPVGAMKPMRVQGAFVSDPEVEAVTTFIRNQFQDVHYDDSFINQLEIEAEKCGQQKKKVASDEIDADDELDPKFYEAVEVAVEMGKISTSLLQRKLSLGYGRAAKIIDKMEQMGIVGPQEGQKPRNTLISRQDYQEMVMKRAD